MRRVPSLLAAGALLGTVTISCNGTTGDTLLTFSAYASGVPDAAKPFQAGDFTIQLSAAKMLLGALYFDESPPGTGFDGPVCIASGVYAAQVPGPVTVDLLSSSPQEFSVYGNGTADTALSWDVWLTDGDVNEVNFAPIVQLEGTATDANGTVVSFGAVVTINASNRLSGSSDPAQPGLNPLCKQRIVQIPTNTTFSPGGTLYVTVDPRVWFQDLSDPINFSAGQLPVITDPNCNPDFSVSYSAYNYALPPETPPPSTQTCGGSSQPCCNADADAGVPAGVGTSGCLGPLMCSSGYCGPTYCIPNSSLLSASEVSSTAAAAGFDFFDEVISGAPFSVSYVQGQP
jgi:hypothetical protein